MRRSLILCVTIDLLSYLTRHGIHLRDKGGIGIGLVRYGNGEILLVLGKNRKG